MAGRVAKETAFIMLVGFFCIFHGILTPGKSTYYFYVL